MTRAGEPLCEVALEGPRGCTLPELWNLMATARATGGDGGGALDAAAKDFAWARLTQHARLGEIRILSAAPPPLDYGKAPADKRVSKSREEEVAEQEEADLEKLAIGLDDPSLRSRADAEARGVYLVAPQRVRDLALGLGDADAWLSKPPLDQRLILAYVAARRNDPRVCGALVSEMTKDIKAAHKFVISDANYQTKCLIAAGLVRTRTVLAEAKPGEKARGHRGNKTAAATLTALRRRGAGDGDDGDDDVAAEAIVTNARARELAGTLERALGEAEGGVMIDNELKVKMVSELEKGGWDVERLHDRRVVSRIYARVRSYMLESGAAETVLAKVEGHEDKQATLALRLVALGAGGSRVRGGDDEDDAEKDDEDAATFARGGGALSLESRIEDRVVSMCLAAGESGCKVSDLARMFQIGVKPFGKRVAAMEAQRHVFGVHKHVKLEGKIKVAYLYHDTAVAPPSGPGGDDAAKRLRAERGALICEHLADEGYLIRAYVGRWLAEKEGGDLQPVGKKVMEPIVRDLEEAKALRREFIATSTGGHMNAGSEPHEVLLHPTFPELTDAMREKIRQEIVDKERFARTPAWKRNVKDARANGSRAKDVASASASGYAPAPGSALALTSTEPGGDGSSSLVETVTVTVKTAGVRPYMRGRSYGGFIGSRPDDAKARARRARPFRASRDHAVLSLGFNPFLAIRLARLHEFLARAAFFGEKKAKKEKKEAAAAAAAHDEDDDDEDDDADASPVLFSRELDVSALVTSTMPVDLFLHLAGCPEGLEDADPAMLARLCARAVEDATVGDLDPDEFAALFGDAGGGGAVAADDGDDERGDEGDGNNAGGFAAAMATAQRDKLSRLLRLLCAMGLAERSIRTTSDGRVSITHRLARRGTYGTDPVDANAVASYRVDTPAGLAAYWDGLETTFKGKISGDGCMIGVFPNEHFACAGADHGLCGSKTWTRSRDATAAQRLELLDAFQLARVQAYRIGKMDAGAGADEDEDEDEARAAARAASLKPEVPAVSALEHLANRTGLDVNRVRAFHSADQRRVQEYLVSEGTVSREEVNAAELERETRRKEKSERRRAEEERKRQNRNAARPGRLESVGPSVAAAPSASGFAPAPGALALVSAAAAPPRGNEKRPKSEKFFWTPKTDAELVFAVVRSLITRGPEYNLFSGLASRDVKLPADAHRCNVRFQKHVNTGERKGLIEETVALFTARRARGNVRAETEDDDDAAAAAADEPANRWDAEGVWCESVEAELKEKVREMLSVHPPKYRRQHFLGSYDSDGDSADGVPVGRLARSDSDSDDEDEVPLANLVRGTDSDSDSDEDDSDSDSDEDEGGSRALKRARRGDAPVAARARRDFADEPPESRVAFANALELVKMFVMHRVDHPEDDAGKRALRETMVAVGEDAIQRAIDTLRRARLLAGGGDAPFALDARFFQAADDRAVGGGAIADAADAAGDLRAASMPGRTSRCERPTAGQTLALLAAVARARVSLSPAADPASVETLPPTYPANADARETEASDEHLTDAANGLRVRVDGHGGSNGTRPAARAAAGAAAGAAGADAYPTPMDAAGPGVDDRGADDVDRVAVSDAAAAACGAGPGGISASELAARTGASVAACEAALRAARDAGDAAEVNAYTEFRYVAEAHAARFRVKHPASLDAAPPPGAAPSPQIRPWLRPDGTTNERFVAGLRRRARGAAIRWPGIPRLNLAGYLVPALTPAVADEFVRGMIERGELIVEMTSAAPETEGAPPPALRSAAANAAAEAAAREAPTAHVFAPQDCAAWG